MHRISYPYTAAQNGFAERKHRHIVETGLALLAHSHLPLPYWTDAFTPVVYLINRLPTSVLHHQSPYAKLLKKNPDYTLLKVFGCACFPLLRPYNNHKSQKCIFLGYSSNYRGYRCYDPLSNKTIISRHIVFDEHTFPAKDWISTMPLLSTTDFAPTQVSSFTNVSSTMTLNPLIIDTKTSIVPATSPSSSPHSESSALPSIYEPSSPQSSLEPSSGSSHIPHLGSPNVPTSHHHHYSFYLSSSYDH